MPKFDLERHLPTIVQQRLSATHYAYKMKHGRDRAFIRMQCVEISARRITAMQKIGWEIERLW